MPDRPAPTKVNFLHDDPPEIKPPVCEVCRAQLWIPSEVSRPGDVPDALLICVVCYFDGPGEKFVESHHADTRKVLVCQRVDGKEPEESVYKLDTENVVNISEDG